ncbi:hypothetical protein V6N13_142303 [Hibiscus sabdariffa]|uniref:Uncharacterized protein n=1 Tax=Hibiscus sabdariffa TaxID=183260 RepID=A0ABR2FE69_9ROSI
MLLWSCGPDPAVGTTTPPRGGLLLQREAGMHATPTMLPLQQANFAPAMHAGMQLLRGLDEKACMGPTTPPPGGLVV